MKNFKIVFVITVLIQVVLGNYALAQDVHKNLTNTEGIWVYNDERIEFTVALVPVKIVMADKNFDRIVGYVKLKIDDELILDRLNVAQNISAHQTYDSQQIFNPKKQDEFPNITLFIDSNEIFGTYKITNKIGGENLQVEKGLKMSVKFENSDMIWNFSDFGFKLDKVSNHIPSVPSSWVLKKVS
jgi:hypothetical protein